ncbi:MAG: autotransporter domain-containing protein [Phycisphaerae bacterium]|nr:autotransporter domain-containing protein [Phycisphaerae bacterium]
MKCGENSLRAVFAIVASMLFWGVICVLPAAASITTLGDVDPSYDDSDPWILSAELLIGGYAEGSVAVSAGSQVLLAWDPESGLGGDLFVGGSGNGTLQIGPEGWVVSDAASIGHDARGVGEVVVSGSHALWENDSAIQIGASGTGRLGINDGGAVATADATVAAMRNSEGMVAVEGTSSVLEVEQKLIVGALGNGSLSISDGGTVTSYSASIGDQAGGEGSVMVQGAGSLWQNADALYVGRAGQGELTISQGGCVTSRGATIKGQEEGAAVVTVTGTGSRWTNTNMLTLGDRADPGVPAAGAREGYGTIAVRDGGTVETGDMVVWESGVLTGDGVFEASEITNHGIIRPGNSIGTLTIEGDLTMGSNGVLEVEIDNSGNSDRLLVAGSMYLPYDGVTPVPLETLTGPREYTIVEASSVEIPIHTWVWPSDPGLIYSTIRTDSEAESVLLRVTVLPFDDPNVVQTDAQCSLGSALQQVADAGGNDITTALQQLQTGDAVRAAYDQLSGQTMPSLAPVTVAGATRHVAMISGRLRSPAASFADAGLFTSDAVGVDTGRYLFALGSGTPAFGDSPWGFWGKGYGLFGDRDSESGVPGYDYAVYGAGFGLDYRFTDRLLLGVTAGYSDGDIDYSGSRDSSEVSATHGGFYGSYETSRWYLDSIVTYADLDYETQRYVDLVSERLDGDSSGDTLTGYLEVGLNRWISQRTLLQPLAAVQFSTLSIDGFTESGGDSALTFDDQRYDSCKGSLGAKLSRQLWDHGDGRKVALDLRARWVHEFGDTKASLDAAFASDPSAAFRVSDESISRDSAVLGAGLDAWFTRQTRLFLDYGTELNADSTTHLVSAGLEHRW